MKYERIWRALLDTPWALQEAKLGAIVELLELRIEGRSPLAFQAASAPTASQQGGVQVLPLFGVISQRMDLMSEFSGGTSTERFAAQFQEAVNDPGVAAIVLNVDSPGGSVYGVQELADKIHAARGSKPIVAVANSLAASAAYWLAAAADEVVVTPSGEVGSIGVYGMHQDVSRAADAMGITTTLVSAGRKKTHGNPYEPLAEEALADMQSRVDAYYAAFTSAVARGRGVSAAAVRDGFGEGAVVGAQQAVKLGMADRVGTLDETIARLANPRQRARVGRRAEDDGLDLAADLDYRRRRLRVLSR